MLDQKCVVQQYIVCLVDEQHSLSLHLSFKCEVRIVNLLLDIQVVQLVQVFVDFFVDTHKQIRAVKYGEVFDVLEFAFKCNDASDHPRLSLAWRDREEDSALLLFIQRSYGTRNLIVVEVIFVLVKTLVNIAELLQIRLKL